MTTTTNRPLAAIDVDEFDADQQSRIEARVKDALGMTHDGITTETSFSSRLGALVGKAITVISLRGSKFTVSIRVKADLAKYHVMVQPFAGAAVPAEFKPMTMTRVNNGPYEGAIYLTPGWN